MRPIFKLGTFGYRCPFCAAEVKRYRDRNRSPPIALFRGSKVNLKSTGAILWHFREFHSFGSYKLTLHEKNKRGNIPFTMVGPCACGCGEKIDLTYYCPDHEPPYFKSGHKSRVNAHMLEEAGLLPTSAELFSANNKGRFREGNTPWNDGTAGSGVCKPNSGSFAKGHVPANAKDGIARSGGYLYKVSGGRHPCGALRRVNVARQVAGEMLDRPIRPDEVVIHRDKDGTNNDPSNLEVITMAENAKRNRGHKPWKDSRKKPKEKLELCEICKKAPAAKYDVLCDNCAFDVEALLIREVTA